MKSLLPNVTPTHGQNAALAVLPVGNLGAVRRIYCGWLMFRRSLWFASVTRCWGACSQRSITPCPSKADQGDFLRRAAHLHTVSTALELEAHIPWASKLVLQSNKPRPLGGGERGREGASMDALQHRHGACSIGQIEECVRICFERVRQAQPRVVDESSTVYGNKMQMKILPLAERLARTPSLNDVSAVSKRLNQHLAAENVARVLLVLQQHGMPKMRRH